MNRRFYLYWNKNIVKKTIMLFSFLYNFCSCIHLGVGDWKCWYLFTVHICTKICTYIYTCKYRLCTTNQKIIILNLSPCQFTVSQRKQWFVFVCIVLIRNAFLYWIQTKQCCNHVKISRQNWAPRTGWTLKIYFLADCYRCGCCRNK